MVISPQYSRIPDDHGANGHGHVGNLYTTFMNAVGGNRDTFGQMDPLLGTDFDQYGPCNVLLAS